MMDGRDYVFVERDGNRQALKKRILKELEKGPVLSFGCEREIDKALQSLRRAGKIQHVRKHQGGHGWELVK